MIGFMKHFDALALASTHCFIYSRVAAQRQVPPKKLLTPAEQHQNLQAEVESSTHEAARNMTEEEVKAHKKSVTKLRQLQLKNGTDVPAIAAEEGFAPIANLWSRSKRTLDRLPGDNRLFHDAEFQTSVDGAVQRIEGGTRVEWVKRGGGTSRVTLNDQFSLSLHEMMNRVEAFPADMKALRLRIANLNNKAHALEAFIESGSEMFDEGLKTTLARFTNGGEIENVPLVARNRLQAKQLLDETKALLKQEEDAYAVRDREQALSLRKLEISFDYYLQNTLNENPNHKLAPEYQSLMDRFRSLRDNQSREGLALEKFNDALEPSVAAKMDITEQQLSVERSSRRLRPLMIVPTHVFEPLKQGMSKMSSVIGAADKFFMNAKIAGQDITALNGLATSDAQKGVIKALKTTGFSGTLMYLSRVHGSRVLAEVGAKVGIPTLTTGGVAAWLKWGNDETIAREKDCYSKRDPAEFEACRDQLLNTLFPNDPNLVAFEKAQKAEMDPRAPQNRADYALYLRQKREELLQSQN